MKFKHYATEEIVEVKVIINTMNETIVEDLKTGKLMVVKKNKNGDYQIKKTSFLNNESQDR